MLKVEKDSNWYQVLVIFVVSILSSTYGLFFAWPSATIPVLINENYPIRITIEECSYFSMFTALSQIIASPIYSIAMNRYGRKWTMLFIALPNLLAWLSVAFADSIYIFYLSRLFNGLSDAGVYTVLPAYIGEIATPAVRGFWGAVPTIATYLGEFLINLVGTLLSVKNTAYVMATLPIIFAVSFFYMPETPYYYLQKRDVAGAQKSLKKLRMKSNVDAELKQLNEDVQRQLSEPGTLKDLFTIKANRKALLVGVFLRIAQQFSGYAGFVVYNQYLFLQAGDDLSYETSSNIFIGLLMTFIILAIFTLDRFGRRLTMITSCCSSGLVLLLETIFFLLKDYTDVDVSSINWLPMIGMLVYTFTFAIGLAIVPTLMLSELFSSSVKGASLTINSFVYAISTAISTKIFETLTTNFGLTSTMGLHTVCCFIFAIISYYLIPETKGKTLEEIQQTLMGNDKKKKNLENLENI